MLGAGDVMIEITQDEAEMVLTNILAKTGFQGKLDTLQNLNAIIGVINIIRVMQEMGWRINRPLESVKENL